MHCSEVARLGYPMLGAFAGGVMGGLLGNVPGVALGSVAGFVSTSATQQYSCDRKIDLAQLAIDGAGASVGTMAGLLTFGSAELPAAMLSREVFRKLIVSGAVAGFSSDTTKQTLEVSSGRRNLKGLSAGEILLSTSLGGVFSAVFGVAGLKLYPLLRKPLTTASTGKQVMGEDGVLQFVRSEAPDPETAIAAFQSRLPKDLPFDRKWEMIEVFTREYGWGIPNQSGLSLLAQEKAILDYAAGNGLLIRLLKPYGVDAVGVENFSALKLYHPKVTVRQVWSPLKIGNLHTIRSYSDRTLVLSFPPGSSEMASTALDIFISAGGTRVAFIGEIHPQFQLMSVNGHQALVDIGQASRRMTLRTGDLEFFKRLSKNFRLVGSGETLKITNDWEHVKLYIFELLR